MIPPRARAALIVLARTAGGDRDADGLSLFLVPKGAAGLSVDPLGVVDHRAVAAIDGGDERGRMVREGEEAVEGELRLPVRFALERIARLRQHRERPGSAA